METTEKFRGYMVAKSYVQLTFDLFEALKNHKDVGNRYHCSPSQP